MSLHHQFHANVAQEQTRIMLEVAQNNRFFIDPLGGIHTAQGTSTNPTAQETSSNPHPSQSSQSVPCSAPRPCLPSDQPYTPMPKTGWMISLFGQLGIILHQNLHQDIH